MWEFYCFIARIGVRQLLYQGAALCPEIFVRHILAHFSHKNLMMLVTMKIMTSFGIVVILAALAGCTQDPQVLVSVNAQALTSQPAAPATQPATQSAVQSAEPLAYIDVKRELVDFEDPQPPVQWTAEEERVNVSPGSSGPPNLRRTAEQPEHGLWSLAIPVRENGRMMYTFPQPVDLRTLDLLSLPVQQRGSSSKLLAAVVIVDADEHLAIGDMTPLDGTWRRLLLDLNGVTDIDLSRITQIGIKIEYAEDATRQATLATDHWVAQQSQKSYVGQRYGMSRSFYVQRNGLRLHVGQVDRFEMTFIQCSGTKRAWLEMTQGAERQMVMGQPHTGLMLLGQEQFDALGRSIRQVPMADKPEDPVPEPFATVPQFSWPAAVSSYEWSVVWSSSVAAMVDVKQTAGWADDLGRAPAVITWRFMIYATGQVYVQADWHTESASKLPDPVTIALCLKRPDAAGAQNILKPLLHEIYADSAKRKYFPHEFQSGNPVVMLAKVNETEPDIYWRADAGEYRLFGVGLPQAERRGPVNCMMLVNSPTQVDTAAAFANYLRPPQLRIKLGRQERTFPGDRDNDGLVEAYGFLVIRMAPDQVWFTIDPQNRPVYYPAILICPGVKDAGKRKLLVNLEGRQFSELPRWPDGSYLLQIPYTLAKPVNLEARLLEPSP